MALQPKLIDYPYAQLLLIGQSIQRDASMPPGLKHEDTETPEKQLKEFADLLDETEKNCRGDFYSIGCVIVQVADCSPSGVDAIYGDLGLEAHRHPKISTVWDH